MAHAEVNLAQLSFVRVKHKLDIVSIFVGCVLLSQFITKISGIDLGKGEEGEEMRKGREMRKRRGDEEGEGG